MKPVLVRSKLHNVHTTQEMNYMDDKNNNTNLNKFAASSRNCTSLMVTNVYKPIPINYDNSFIITCKNISLARGCF